MRAELQFVQCISLSIYRLLVHPEFSLCFIWLLLILIYVFCWIHQRRESSISSDNPPHCEAKELVRFNTADVYLCRDNKEGWCTEACMQEGEEEEEEDERLSHIAGPFCYCEVVEQFLVPRFTCLAIEHTHNDRAYLGVINNVVDLGDVRGAVMISTHPFVYAPSGSFPVQIVEYFEDCSTASLQWHDGWSAAEDEEGTGGDTVEVSASMHQSAVCLFADECGDGGGGGAWNEKEMESENEAKFGRIECWREDGEGKGRSEEKEEVGEKEEWKDEREERKANEEEGEEEKREMEEVNEDEEEKEDGEREESMGRLLTMEAAMKLDPVEVENGNAIVHWRKVVDRLLVEAEPQVMEDVKTERFDEMDWSRSRKKAGDRRWRRWLKRFHVRVRTAFGCVAPKDRRVLM